MIIEKDAFAIANAVKNGEIKAEDVARKFLNYVKSADKKVEAFNSLDEERIIKAAIEVDKKRDRGEELGELAGVPFIIKDNIMSEGEPVTCSSKMMLGYKAIYDATVVKKIRSADGAGALMLPVRQIRHQRCKTQGLGLGPPAAMVWCL